MSKILAPVQARAYDRAYFLQLKEVKMDYAPEVAVKVLQSPLVDDGLFSRGLGSHKEDIEAVKLYLLLPIATRPELSWFFDKEFYLETYSDVKRAGNDPLVHFLLYGVGETRSPHPLIDLGYIRGTYRSSVLGEHLDGERLYHVLVNDLADPSAFFSREHYRRQCSARNQQPSSGLLRHFLEYGILHGLSPSPDVDVIGCYVQAGTGFDIRSGLRQLAARKGRLSESTSTLLAEWRAKAQFRNKATFLLPILARQPLDFEIKTAPELSVIMVLHNQFALTLMALTSLRDTFPGSIELLIVDSGSTDETIHLSQYVRGSTIIRFDSNVGFVRACSGAVGFVSSEYVLFLNNDIELAHGAVHAALRRAASDPKIGAVGAKIIRSDGCLQEAGGIIWRDGWTTGYLRDEYPLAPEANFVRDVEFCSLAFLLARTDVIREVGSFDLDYAPAYFEDTDLCLRIKRTGRRIVYDPQVVVHHLEYGSSQNEQANAQMAQSHATFLAKHRDDLQTNYCRAAGADLLARSTNEVKGRVLFIEEQLPLRRLGSGYVRSNTLITTLAALGYAVTVYPMTPSSFDPAAIYADFPDTVEVMHNVSLPQFGDFLADRRGYYQTIWVCRTHNLSRIKDHLETYGAGLRVVLDTEAISAIRDWSRSIATSADEPIDLWRNAEREIEEANRCSFLVAVSDAEAEMLRVLGHARVVTLGHLVRAHPTQRRFEDRSGMLFVGAIHSADSPNYDSLCWFIEEVLPHIEDQLGWETRLTIAGFSAPGIGLMRFRDHPRVTLRGAIANLEPLYEAHRIFIAPTRFAAGIPYKLHEAASYGVPIVATELLRSQLGWVNGMDLLSAEVSNPQEFARLCIRLYSSEELWTSLRESAMRRLALECNQSDYEAKLLAILETV
jgi:GT2 family glycosyltransferase/glycosyltransferase involved in cell wall biosynthesis